MRVSELLSVAVLVVLDCLSKRPQCTALDAHVRRSRLKRQAGRGSEKRSDGGPELTAGMVEAAVQGKAALALKLKFELAQRPKVGQPLDVNLALVPQLAGSPLVLQVTASDGIEVNSTSQSFEVPSVEAGAVYLHTLRLTPKAEGVLIVGLNVSAQTRRSH